MAKYKVLMVRDDYGPAYDSFSSEEVEQGIRKCNRQGRRWLAGPAIVGAVGLAAMVAESLFPEISTAPAVRAIGDSDIAAVVGACVSIAAVYSFLKGKTYHARRDELAGILSGDQPKSSRLYKYMSCWMDYPRHLA